MLTRGFILIWSGVEGSSRESESSTRSHEESFSDEQDSEADKCWNCANEMNTKNTLIGLNGFSES